MKREGALKLGIMNAGVAEPIADLIVGIAGPSLEAGEAAIASIIEKNEAAALDSLFSAYEHARNVTADMAEDDNATDAAKLRIAAVEDEILRRIAVLAGIEEDEDPEEKAEKSNAN